MSNWKPLSDSRIMIDNTIFEVGSVTQESASNFLGHMYNEGMKPGKFTGLIIQASMAADYSNLAKLEQSFPQFTQVARLLKSGGVVGYDWVKSKSLDLGS